MDETIPLNPSDYLGNLEKQLRTVGAWSTTKHSMGRAHFFLAKNPSIDKAMSRCGAQYIHIQDIHPIIDPEFKCLACALFETSEEEVKLVNERMIKRETERMNDK